MYSLFQTLEDTEESPVESKKRKKTNEEPEGMSECYLMVE